MDRLPAGERWHSVPAEALAGGRAVVEAGGRQILLVRVGGGVYALDNACPHEGNPLADGEVLGDELECVYHGWRFDLATGSCPAIPLLGIYPKEIRAII